MKYSRIDKYHKEKIDSNNFETNGKNNKKRLRKTVKIFIFSVLAIFFLTYFIITYSKEIAIGNIKTNEYNINSKLITKEYHGTKVVHFSDIHYGTSIDKELLTNIVNEINLTKPDIVIFTGDLFDKDVTLNSNDLEDLSKILSKIDSTYGKYAIKGDNDFIDAWSMVIENSGFIDINNTYDCIYNKNNEVIMISGLSSNIKDKKSISKKLENIYDYLNNNKVTYSILALHEPDFIDKINLKMFNLVLAGHTLGGEVKLPIIGGTNYPKYGKKYIKNYYKKSNTDIYISNGLGTSDLKMRLFNNPSFNLYRLRKK